MFSSVKLLVKPDYSTYEQVLFSLVKYVSLGRTYPVAQLTTRRADSLVRLNIIQKIRISFGLCLTCCDIIVMLAYIR